MGIAYILSDEIDDPRLAGGKAAALAHAAAAGLPVPGWFTLSNEAFTESLHHCGLTLDAPDLFERFTLAPHIAAVVAQAVDALLGGAPGLLAVRSSASVEDGAAFSYAGQFESVLGVQPADVPQAVVRVWRSGFAQHVQTYRALQGQDEGPALPHVLIQRLLAPDVAGVAFSADPVSGRRGVAVINAVCGLADMLVQGEQDGDTYTVGRGGDILTRSIAPKTFYRIYDPQRGGPVSVPAADASASAPALSDEQIIRVAALARQAERAFGRPQDIEWAAIGDQLYLLQSRPITTLARLNDPDAPLIVWDNSNIVESYSGVTTPLTFSFARTAYEEVYRQFCQVMGVPRRRIEANQQTFRGMLGLIQGRIYYNLLNWYRTLALLPGFSLNRAFMEQMMGVRRRLPEELVQRVQAEAQGSSPTRLADAAALASTVIALLAAYTRLPRTIRRFYARLNDALGHQPPDLTAMRPDELAAYYQRMVRQILPNWDAPIINDFFTMIFFGLLRAACDRWCAAAGQNLHNSLMMDTGAMISAEPAHRIQALGALAAAHPRLVQALMDGTVRQAERAMAQVPEFNAAYQDYLNTFGERCLEELKLESATLNDDPLPLLRAIGRAAQPPTDQAAPQRIPVEVLKEQAEDAAFEALKGKPLRRAVFKWVLGRARWHMRTRENLRFERTRVFGRARSAFLEMGRKLAALDLLDSPRDVFYLTVDEIIALVEGSSTLPDLRALVGARISQFGRFRAAPAPAERFETRGLPYQGHSYQAPPPPAGEADQPAQGDERQGIACCPGIVRARVQVIREPQGAMLEPGCILVAHHTDPGWVMLFPAAAGLLVERGSLLSHSAIVARELGIPAVVGVPGLLEWLHTGDLVEMNGADGSIRRIEA